jgi:outer membrane biogenesis lipoprotein LolB
MAEWLAQRPGREADAEQAYRDAAATGHPVALRELVDWLDMQPGRRAEAELARRVGLDARGNTAMAPPAQCGEKPHY